MAISGNVMHHMTVNCHMSKKFLTLLCTFCLKNNDDNALLSSVLKFTSIMDEKGWQKKRHAKNVLFFGPFYNFYWIKLQKNSHHHHLRI